MKDNYSGIVALLEWADRQRTKERSFKHPKSKTPRMDFDVIDLLNKEEAKIARVKKYFEEREKLNKKEDPKKGLAAIGSKLSSLDWFILGILLYPIVGPAYKALITIH